jgi:hypothetical protein
MRQWFAVVAYLDRQAGDGREVCDLRWRDFSAGRKAFKIVVGGRGDIGTGHRMWQDGRAPAPHAHLLPAAARILPAGVYLSGLGSAGAGALPFAGAEPLPVPQASGANYWAWIGCPRSKPCGEKSPSSAATRASITVLRPSWPRGSRARWGGCPRVGRPGGSSATLLRPPPAQEYRLRLKRPWGEFCNSLISSNL